MAEKKDILWLVSPVADDALGLDDGQTFWKELIREGRWINVGAGFTLQVDDDRLGRWERNFREMADAGIRVPVPWGHSYDPRDNAGFVEEIELRDGSLWGLLNVPHEDDAGKVGSTVRAVSVSINPDFVDGSGRRWGEVIEHVALTNYPVVSKQENFIQAADDGEGRRAVALELDGGQSTMDDGPDGESAGPKDVEPETQDADPAEVEGAEHEAVVSEPETENAEPATYNAELGTRNSELTNRLYQLELERAEHEVDEALRLGKFTRPAAEALRQLIAAGIERRYSFDAAGPDGLDVAEAALSIIANTVPGAAVDMTEHTQVHPVPQPGSGMTADRAAQLARENKALAGV